jgi:hypothetical protein
VTKNNSRPEGAIAFFVALGIASAALVAFAIWGPKQPEDPLGVVLLMAYEYEDQLNAQGIPADLVECAPVDGDGSRDTYACSFKISGELRRIDCNIGRNGGCYPAK